MLLGLVGCTLLGLGITTALLTAEITFGMTLFIIATLMAGFGALILDVILIIKG